MKDIQNTLNSRYSAGLTVDGFCGAKTKSALIRALQTELNKQCGAGLVADGIWGAKTLNACISVRKGASGNLTYILQASLYASGYKTLIDSIFGDNTFSTLKSFQSAKGLSPDGIAGKNTWEKLLG